MDVRYIKSNLGGLTVIDDTKAEEGKGIRLSLTKGVVVDLNARFTVAQIKESYQLQTALKKGLVVAVTKEDYEKSQSEPEIVPEPVVPKVIMPADDNDPYLAELENIEDRDVDAGEMDEKKRLIVDGVPVQKVKIVRKNK